ncbi:hypothetical protein BN1013_02176 [Candidatus Rubidus massiliensis]|nr:hypothetical protein BN1013_02176 [Candidatus Rubidus massiliensis]
MRNTFFAILTLITFQSFAFASTSTNLTMASDSAGNTVAVWEFVSDTYDSSIEAAFLPAGSSTWSSSVTVAGPVINPKFPKVSINDSGNIVLIWTEIDSFWGLNVLYGSTATFGGSWSTPTQISTTDENVSTSNYNAKITATDDIVLTWTSFDNINFDINARSATSSFGSWGTPVTISP